MTKNRTYRFSTLMLLLFCLTLSAAFGQTEKERIIRFHSDITIDTTGRIEVAEHIRVYADGNEIKRGIVRELPLYRKNNKGKKVNMGYNILSVKCNGTDGAYHTENTSEKLEIYTGEADVLLKAGEYDYIITYESYGHIGFFADYDDLYWNVTGDEWIFPIEEASATITLPAHAEVIQTACYTGKHGETGNDCTMDNAENIPIFTTTRLLAPHEGLTIGVSFTRDIVTRPPPPTKGEIFWEEHGATTLVLAGLFLCVVYCLLTLLTAGKRPVKPVAIPTFKPPRDFSPATIHRRSRREFNKKAFTATLVEMAVKGAMSIKCEEKSKKWSVYSLIKGNNTEHLRPEEQAVYDTVFDTSETVKVSSANSEKFIKSHNSLKSDTIKGWTYKEYYKDKFFTIFFGGILLNLTFLLYLFTGELNDGLYITLLAASPFIFIEIYAITRFISIAPSSTMKNVSLGCSSIPTFFLVLVGLLGIIDSGSVEIHWLLLLFLSVPSLLFAWYARYMKRFTEEGAKFAAEFEGFQMYMKTAEEHRLNMLTPPEKTPELFEKLLPYAIALNLSNEWCQKFGEVLENFDYKPNWYHSDKDFTDSMTAMDFTTAFVGLSTAFNMQVGAVSEPKSSGSSDWSSGGSGGGYSGGGGGGGGGRRTGNFCNTNSL